MTATPNKADITAFIELLHTHAKATGVDGVLVLTGYGEDPLTGEKLPPRMKSFNIGDVSQMVDLAMTWTVQKHINVYAAPVVMRPNLPAGKRGGKKDIKAVFALVADYDDFDAANWPNRVSIAPSYVLQTSFNRFQTGFFLDPSDYADAETLAKRLQLTAQCDHGTGDIDHVWRIPGTLNWANLKKFKEGRSLEPVLVKTVPGGTGAVVPGLATVLVPLNERTKTESKSKPRAGVNLDALIARYKFVVVSQQPWKDDSQLYKLEACPFNPDHTRASLIQFADGGADFNCFHNSCASYHWAALRGRLAEMAVDLLRKLSLDDIKKTWLSYVNDLDAIGVQALITEVSRLTGIGLRALKQAVAEHRFKAIEATAAERIADRTVISLYTGDLCHAATEIETAMVSRLTDGECIRCGECVMSVTLECLPRAHQADSELPALPTAHFTVMTRAKLLPLVERATIVRNEAGKLLDVPERVLDQILTNAKAIPQVSALITHPIVTQNGRIISAKGIDKDSRLLLHGPEIEGLHPYTRDEARDGLQEIDALALEGFDFASPLDRAVALSMLLTTVERKLLDSCPGALADASQQGSGKTTLVRRTHIIVTGADLPVFTLPDNEGELRKLLFSALLSSPAIICFDNVGDGLRFASPTVAAAMTSATTKDRVLGFSREASVSTATFFILTGNNVELGTDESSRIMPTRLISKNANPHKRTFTQPDVFRHALKIREVILRHVVGIVSGYRQSTDRIESASRFSQWDALVRQPLIWAGGDDVGKVFDLNIENSTELAAHRALVIHLKKIFPGKDFSAGRLVKFVNADAASGRESHPLVQALLALRVKDIHSERSVGHALSRMSDRTVEIDGSVWALTRRMVHGLTQYQVDRRGDSL